MRHNVSHLVVTATPDCPACGAPTVFTQQADIARDGRVHLIFRCPACNAGETKVWRPEWQDMVDLVAQEE
jgi:hypothetical protein